MIRIPPLPKRPVSTCEARRKCGEQFGNTRLLLEKLIGGELLSPSESSTMGREPSWQRWAVIIEHHSGKRNDRFLA